ncbi:unnamed protein product [Onchocerca flexuosa]|uniref:Uncharacterized protein n=1 Tax=Onchocerca flexuosa TaxID=387005 RepID=A0A183HH74_9BILA|nr:unnamed protein product [Onchocerca flexuosa]
MLKANNSWFSGNYAKAIQDTFLELDELLRSETVMKELKKMAGTVEPKHEDLSDDDEDKQVLYEEAGMPIESILERYGIVLHRDRNGKQSIELPIQFEQQGEGEEQITVESDKKIEENGSNILERETNGKNQNGDAVIDNKINADENQLKKAEEKAVEEKSKKRLSESSPSNLKAKRTRSSNDIEEFASENTKDTHSNISTINKSGAIIQDERCETAGETEVAKSEPEVAGPAEVDITVKTSINSGDKNDFLSPNENAQPSATSDGQVTFSSDSESVDEDYNADEEISEGEEEEEMDDEEMDDR